MTINMVNIGKILDSRPAGRESLLAMRTHFKDAKDIVIDFRDVDVLTPSFADEFITPLLEEFPGHVSLKNTQQNITVTKTLEFLAEDWPNNVPME